MGKWKLEMDKMECHFGEDRMQKIIARRKYLGYCFSKGCLEAQLYSLKYYPAINAEVWQGDEDVINKGYLGRYYKDFTEKPSKQVA